MAMPSEVYRSGLDALATITELLQRVRAAHPTFGQYEAAELHWWWGIPRSSDHLDQLFWIDDRGRPEAAAVITDFGDGTSALYTDPTLVVSTMPDTSSEWVAHVIDRGLAHAAANGIDTVEIEVDRADDVQRTVLFDRGFTIAGDALVICWLDVGDRPAVSPLADGYRLASRADTADTADTAAADSPHHMADTRRPDIEQRLQQTSLYRPDLDLVVLHEASEEGAETAGYGMFWFDPHTATGVVEPMRTEDDHQRRGLARHILTSGVERLAAAGATRISIGYQPDNPASGHLYRSVGFEPHRQNDLLTGPTR